MTTIVWKPGEIACDKCVTEDNITAANGQLKAVETADKVYAVTGTLCYGLRFIEWLKGKRQKRGPRLKDCVVIEYDKRSGKAWLWEHRDVRMPLQNWYATGSGGQVAMGALAMGADAEQAVRIASKYDAYTGYGVQVWRKE